MNLNAQTGAFAPRGRTGFTLLELLITMAIAALVLSLAAPSFQAMLMNNRLAAQVDALATGLSYARSIALSQSVRAQICPVGVFNSTTCGASWAAGWMVVSDPAGTPVLRQSHQIVGGNPALSASATQVVFDARGLAGMLVSFKLCDSRGATFSRSVQVLATGLVQVGATPGQAAWGGAALSCP